MTGICFTFDSIFLLYMKYTCIGCISNLYSDAVSFIARPFKMFKVL